MMEVREFELDNNSSLRITGSDESSASAVMSFDWEVVSKVKKEYLQRNRGRPNSPDLLLNALVYKAQEGLFKIKDQIGREFLNLEFDNSGQIDLWSNDVELELKWDWYPEVPQIDLDTCPILKRFKVNNLTDESIKEYRSKVLSKYKILLDSDNSIEMGDLLTVVWEIKMDEKWESSEDARTQIHLGVRPRLQPDLEHKLIGAKAGDVIEHSFEVPRTSIVPQFNAYKKDIAKLFGKTIELRIRIEKVQKYVLPEINENFLGRFGLKSEEELDEKVLEGLRNKIEDEAKQLLNTSVVDFLRSHDFSVPEAQIKEYMSWYLDNFLRRFALEAKSDNISSWDDDTKIKFLSNIVELVPEYSGKSFDDFISDIRGLAKSRVCSDFLIEKMPKVLDLAEETIEESIISMLFQIPNVTSDRGKFERYRYEFRRSFIMEKLLNYLESNGKIQDEELDSFETFEASVKDIVHDELHLHELRGCIK